MHKVAEGILEVIPFQHFLAVVNINYGRDMAQRTVFSSNVS